MTASYICNRIPHYAVQEALLEGCRPLPSQDHRRKGFCTHHKPNQARLNVVGRDGVRFQRDREQLLPNVELKNTSRDGEQDRRFHRNTTKSSSRGQAALVVTRSRVTVVGFQRRHARLQLRLARRHAAGHAELHLRSGFRRRHPCLNGRIAFASTSLTRRNFTWGSLACGNFAWGS